MIKTAPRKTNLDSILPTVLASPLLLVRLFRYRHFFGKSHEQIFTAYYRTNRWGSAESRSGRGSTLADTEALRRWLPGVISRYGCRSLLDIPCGDFHWMKEVPLDIPYIGADIVKELVDRNQAAYGGEKRTFVTCDITRDALPSADLIMTRDCFLHFSFDDIRRAVRRIKSSDARFLLASTWPKQRWNVNTPTGAGHHFVNLEREPFSFPPPLEMINEGSQQAGGRGRHMGLWKRSDLPDL